MAHSNYNESLEYWWVPAIVDTAAPTTAEMGAGDDLTCLMTDFPDLTISQSTIDDPSLCSSFVPKVPDTLSVDDTEAQFAWDDDPTSDFETVVRAKLTRGTAGFLVRVDAVNGTVPSVTTQGTVVDVWPVKVSFTSKNPAAFGELKKYTVGFTVTSPPSEDVATV